MYLVSCYSHDGETFQRLFYTLDEAIVNLAECEGSLLYKFGRVYRVPDMVLKHWFIS